jgi:hypothetical protein
MMDLRHKIDDSIRRSKRLSIITAIAVIVFVVIAFVGSSLRFVQGYFGQTVILTKDTLTSFGSDSLPVFKAEIISDETFDTGISEETTTKINGLSLGTSTTAYFGLLSIGDHVLLLKTAGPIREEITQYSGVLIASREASVGQEAYSEILKEVPALGEVALPFILDTTYPIWWWFGGLALEAIMLCGGLYLLVRTIWYSNPNNHPIIKNLARFGDVDAVLLNIEREMRDNKYSELGPLNLTQNWLIYSYGPVLQFIRFSEVVWVYNTENNNSIVRIWDRHGEQIGVACTNEEDADGIVTAVTRLAPWAILGSDKTLEKTWKKDRSTFIRMVDERRTEKHQSPL